MNSIFGNFIFWTALSFIVLVVFICIVFSMHRSKRRNYKYMAIIFMLGIYCSNVTFISPLIFFGNAVEWKEQISSYDDLIIKSFSKEEKLPVKTSVFSHFNTEFKITDSELLLRDSILYGLIYSTKMNGLGVKYQALIPTSFYFSIFSGIFFIILTILTPVAFGGLIASFFEGAWTFIIYLFTKAFRDIYYFSDLNDKTLLLAKSIHDKKKHSLIVFCNKNNKVDSLLLQEAKYNGFILFTRSELDFVKYSRKERCFFEMKKDEVKNVSDVSALLNEFQKIVNKYPTDNDNKDEKNPLKKLVDNYYKKKKYNILKNNKIYLLAEKETSYEVINKLQKCVNVIILNRFRTAFYDLLLKKPIYRCLKNGEKDRTDFNITIIGAGKCGTEILKACIWCTQLGAKYTTKINVIDKNASVLENRLKKECPELFLQIETEADNEKESKKKNLYDINFYDCDIYTDSFYKLLKNSCSDTNYITIATGYDDVNLNTAMEVRRFYLKELDKLPMINVFIENDEYLKSVQNLLSNSDEEDKKNEGYHLEAFGSDKDFYSYSMVDNSDVEKLALNSSCVYEEKKGKIKVLSKYYSRPEIERNSNRTNAIHLIYKLFIHGYGIEKKTKKTSIENINNSNTLLTQLKVIVGSDINKAEYEDSESARAKLAQIEKERWNAFYRTEGWCGIPEEKWEIFREHFKTKDENGSDKYNQKNYMVKQHVCICPYKKLSKAGKVFGKDFYSYDFEFIRNLPRTLGLEKEPNPKEPEINVSGVEYILVKL